MSTKEVQATANRKPPAAGMGRKKGTPNKVTGELKNMILGALSDAGGQRYLAERALDPRTAGAFLMLVGKVLPMTLQGPGTNGAVVFEHITRTIIDPTK